MSGARVLPMLTENQLQILCVDYLRLRVRTDVVWHHSPNEGDRSKGAKIHQWKMGMRAGWPDLEIIKTAQRCDPICYGRPRPFIGFVEFKVGHATLADEQFDCRTLLERAGCGYRVCRSLETFQRICAEWDIVK